MVFSDKELILIENVYVFQNYEAIMIVKEFLNKG